MNAYQHHQVNQQYSQQSNDSHSQSEDPNRPTTLWVGDIEKWMDENYLAQLFGKTGIVVSTKIIRDKQTNIPVGYGFVQFSTHETAKKVLELYGNATNPATGRTFRLNWGVKNGASSDNRSGGRSSSQDDSGSGVSFIPFIN